MTAIVDLLPQKAVISPEAATRWIDGVMRWEKDRAEWHVKRLMGIGGSEIGAVVRGVNQLSHSGFSTLPQVIQQKLMLRLPLRQDANMLRGVVLEDLARLSFMYRYGAARDTAAVAAMEGSSPRKGYEWLVGNPDDACLLNGRRFLVDYKVPSSFSEEVDFDYAAQLHHYALRGRLGGVRFDGFLLVKLDIAPELARSLVTRFPLMSEQEQNQLAKTIALADVPGMRVVALGVEHSKQMDIDILDAGRFAWEEYVMKGVVPELARKPVLQMDQSALIDLANLQQQYAMAKAGMSHLSELACIAEGKMQQMLAGVDMTAHELPVNLVKIGPKNHDKDLLVKEAKAMGATPDDLAPEKPTYLVSALVDEIKRLNGDPDAKHLFDHSPDPAKAKSYLESLDGFDVDLLRQPGIAVSLSRKKADKAVHEGMVESAKEVLEPWFQRNVIGNDFDADLVCTDQLEEWSLEAASGTLLGTETASDDADVDSDENQHPMRRGASLR